mmetsp:Transcript_20162/g.64946  ORF Transcript_20162/g.64946 Transcript_20162/m.64946 type:complete len:221 (-) Transcript_20162:187-849(-)
MGTKAFAIVFTEWGSTHDSSPRSRRASSCGHVALIAFRPSRSPGVIAGAATRTRGSRTTRSKSDDAPSARDSRVTHEPYTSTRARGHKDRATCRTFSRAARHALSRARCRRVIFSANARMSSASRLDDEYSVSSTTTSRCDRRGRRCCCLCAGVELTCWLSKKGGDCEGDDGKDDVGNAAPGEAALCCFAAPPPPRVDVGLCSDDGLCSCCGGSCSCSCC